MAYAYTVYVMAPVAPEALLRRAFPEAPSWMEHLRREGDKELEWHFLANSAFWGSVLSRKNMTVGETIDGKRWEWEGAGVRLLVSTDRDLNHSAQRAVALRALGHILESGREDLIFSAEDVLLLCRVDGVIQRFEKDDFWDWVKPDDVPLIMRDTYAFPSPKRSPIPDGDTVADVEPAE